MQGTFVNLCYTMENDAIATMMTYFGSTDHGLGTEVDRVCVGGGGTSSKNRLESPLIYIYIYIVVRSKRVQTPVPLLHSLSDKYPWERYEPPYLSSCGLNSTNTVLVQRWL